MNNYYYVARLGGSYPLLSCMYPLLDIHNYPPLRVVYVFIISMTFLLIFILFQLLHVPSNIPLSIFIVTLCVSYFISFIFLFFGSSFGSSSCYSLLGCSLVCFSTTSICKNCIYCPSKGLP